MRAQKSSMFLIIVFFAVNVYTEQVKPANGCRIVQDCAGYGLPGVVQGNFLKSPCLPYMVITTGRCYGLRYFFFRRRFSRQRYPMKAVPGNERFGIFGAP